MNETDDPDTTVTLPTGVLMIPCGGKFDDPLTATAALVKFVFPWLSVTVRPQVQLPAAYV